MDAVAYMAWQRVVPWKILSMIARPRERLVPIGFGARNEDFYNLLEPRSQIWVVTRIANEFSLAGRVTVREILDRNCIPQEEWPKDTVGLFAKWRFVARADPNNSEFFETNNAEPVIARHRIRFAQNRTIAYRDVSLEDSFKACMDQGRETVFLSYRWEEGKRFAISLAQRFRREGLSPWLDSLAIPKYVVQGDWGADPQKPERRLKKLIKLGIERSNLAVVINTRTFGRMSWTMMELGHIRRAGMPWFQVMRGGRMRKCDEPPIFSRKPEEVVREILKRCAWR
jgi:hypothetical protein